MAKDVPTPKKLLDPRAMSTKSYEDLQREGFWEPAERGRRTMVEIGALVELAIGGEHDAAARLLRSNLDYILGFITQFVKEPKDIDYLVQETVRVCLTRLGDFDHSKPFRWWLRTLMSEIVAQYWKRTRDSEIVYS